MKIIAELWGVSVDFQNTRQAADTLIAKLLVPSKIKNIISSLPSEARNALDDLASNEGRLPWPLFSRRYGEVRDMGSARRDRELPHLKNSTPAEILWYRALLSRSFFDTPDGPIEFAYIPEEFLSHLLSSSTRVLPAPGRPASPAERASPFLATDIILDHACSLLAALRLELSEEAVERIASPWKELNPLPPYPLTPAALLNLLKTADLIDRTMLPAPDSVRTFLESSRGEALVWLCQAWLHSEDFNELRLIPSLKAEGEWKNDPLLARRAIIGFLESIKPDIWWSLAEFVNAIYKQDPDYQRPDGDYDSWFIREVNEAGIGEFMRGFDCWEAVDGELICFILCGPMHWLGLVDLAWAKGVQKGAPAAFRLSKWSQKLLAGEVPSGLPSEDKPLVAGSDGRLRIPRLAPRAARYQLSRFCSWETETDDFYHYRITPASLARARIQGLNVQQLTTLLRRHIKALPPGLIKALERWEQRGVEARIEKLVILRLSSPEILQSLRSTRASRFLGDPLSPTAVIIKPGALERVLAALAEIGFLGEANLEE